MSTPFDTIYGIPSAAGTATGNSDNGSLKHPGDYASAQKIIDFCEHLKDIYDNTHLLHSVINGMIPPNIRKNTEPVNLDLYPEFEGDDYTAPSAPSSA